jgi:hypothetical protein
MACQEEIFEFFSEISRISNFSQEFHLTKKLKYFRKEASRLVGTKSSYRKLVALFFVLIFDITNLIYFDRLKKLNP